MQTYKIENIAPILNVKDIKRSREYYTGILDFTEAEWGKEGTFTSLSRDHCGIYLCENEQGHAGTWVWIGFDGNIQELFALLKAKGALIRMPPTNFAWAWEMHIEDPDGHVLRYGTDPD